MWIWDRREAPVALALLLASVASSCSPGMFGGPVADPVVTGMRSYRRINAACSGLKLATAEIDVQAFRDIVGCFNSDGALDPIARLVAGLDNPDLQPWVEVLNNHLLGDRQMLFDIDTSYEALHQGRILDETFIQFGKLLASEELVSAAITLGKGAYDRGDQVVMKAIQRLSEKMTPGAVSSFLDAGLNLGDAPAFLELQKKLVAGSPAGRDLERDLVAPLLLYLKDADPSRVEALGDLVKAAIDGRTFGFADQLMGADGGAIREKVPALSVLLRHLTGRQGRGAPLIDRLTSLFHYGRAPISCLGGAQLTRSASLYCLEEIARVPSDQAADFMAAVEPVRLAVLAPFCEFPKGVGDYFSIVPELASHPTVGTTHALMKAAVDNGLAEVLTDILSDTGSGREAGVPENESGIKHLFPLMAELTDLEAWDDLLYLAMTATDRQRGELVDALRFLDEPSPVLGGINLIQAGREILAKASIQDIARFMRSLKPFMDDKEPFLVPALRGLRAALHVNDVHPFVELLRRVSADAARNERLFGLFFKVAQRPEFGQSVKLVSSMAQDGRLQDLLGSVLTLFHRFAQEGRHEVRAVGARPFEPERRHSWSSASVALRPVPERGDPAPAACQAVRLGFPLGDPSHPGWSDQVSDLAACVNRDGSAAGIAEAVELLRGFSPPSGGQPPLQRLIARLQSVKSGFDRLAGGGVAHLKSLVDAWARSVDDGRAHRLLSGLRLFVTDRVRGSKEPVGAGGPVARPLLDGVSAALRQEREPLRHVLSFGADTLRSTELPRALKLARTLGERADACGSGPAPGGPGCPDPSVEPGPVRKPIDRHRLDILVRNRECVLDDARRAERVEEIVEAYGSAVTAWSIDPETGQPPRRFTKEQFHRGLEPLFEKFGDPAQGRDRQRSPLQALLNVTRYFSLPARPGVPWGPARPDADEHRHYSPEYMAQWLSRLSNDHRPITYYFPGERRPRVRLVNSLDMFELVVLNADVRHIWPENLAHKFLAAFGQAWGDEPSAIWPRAVRASYPNPARCDALRAGGSEKARRKAARDGDCPRTLRDVFLHGDTFQKLDPFKSLMSTLRTLEKLGGYPKRNECAQVADPYGDTPPADLSGLPVGPIFPLDIKARTYNIRQLVPAVLENLPGSGHPHEGGMRVLRDLFYELHASSPKKCQDATSERCNNLTIVTDLVRMGIVRNVSTKLMRMPVVVQEDGREGGQESGNEPGLLDFFRGLIAGATEPAARPLLDELFWGKRGTELLWGVIDPALDVLDSKDARAAARLRRMTFALVAEAGRLGLAGPALRTLVPFIHEDYDYAVANLSGVADALRSPGLARFLIALHESGDAEGKAALAGVLTSLLGKGDGPGGDTAGQSGLRVLKALHPVLPNGRLTALELALGRADAVIQGADFQRLELKPIFSGLLAYFEQESGLEGDSSRALREGLADFAERDLEALLEMQAAHPDASYRVLETLARESRPGGGIPEFMDAVLRALDRR